MIAGCFPEVTESVDCNEEMVGYGCGNHEITGNDCEVVETRTGVFGKGDKREGRGWETPSMGS